MRIVVPKQYKYEYIDSIPLRLTLRLIEEIKTKIGMLNLTEKEKQEAIKNACDEKLCNLTDTINILWV